MLISIKRVCLKSSIKTHLSPHLHSKINKITMFTLRTRNNLTKTIHVKNKLFWIAKKIVQTNHQSIRYINRIIPNRSHTKSISLICLNRGQKPSQKTPMSTNSPDKSTKNYSRTAKSANPKRISWLRMSKLILSMLRKSHRKAGLFCKDCSISEMKAFQKTLTLVSGYKTQQQNEVIVFQYQQHLSIIYIDVKYTPFSQQQAVRLDNVISRIITIFTIIYLQHSRHIFQKSFQICIFKMSNRVNPAVRQNSYHQPVTSTSRHELRAVEMNDTHDIFSGNRFSLSNIKLKFYLNELVAKIKFLSPPLIKSKNMVEEWQTIRDDKDQAAEKKSKQIAFGKETLNEEISNRYRFIKPLEAIQGVFCIAFCWLVTVSMVFQVKINQTISEIIVFFIIAKFCGKFFVILEDRDKQCTYEINLFEDFIQPSIQLVGALLMMLRTDYQLENAEYIIIVYELICTFLLWRRIGKQFEYLTLYAEQNKLRKELRIVQLFCFTLAMAHIFGLIMYSMIYICPQGKDNWIQKAGLENEPWYTLYIYSYYWANTTMVTVGYGDLTPNNFIQAIIVTVIQVVGTAIFGYMINVIGITVNEIQKKNAQFEEHQATILKLNQHYTLTRQLCHKMKNDIKKKQSQYKTAPLKNNEETQFLEYIDSSLKEDFVLETNMKVIKKSIFFLTHFTVNFQNEIALKLIRRIYKPQENISIEENGERQLVIINNGAVHIFNQFNHQNIQRSKLCRVISPVEGQPTLNVFGFSSLILNRPINLNAVTNETTTAYILKRKDIIQSMSKSMLDFESFNELREKMLQVNKVQYIEAPSIKDIERHFLPNSYLLTKKIKYLNQDRCKINRSNRKAKRTFVTLKHYQNKTLLLIPPSHSQRLDIDSNQLIGLVDNEIKNLNFLGKDDQFSKCMIIDQGKNFQNFMKKYNINVIASEYQRVCMKKNYHKNTHMMRLASKVKTGKDPNFG